MVGFLIAWANAPFAVAAGVALLFTLLQVTGVLGLIAGGGDHDGDAEGGDAHDASGGGHEGDASAGDDARHRGLQQRGGPGLRC